MLSVCSLIPCSPRRKREEGGRHYSTNSKGGGGAHNYSSSYGSYSEDWESVSTLLDTG